MNTYHTLSTTIFYMVRITKKSICKKKLERVDGVAAPHHSNSVTSKTSYNPQRHKMNFVTYNYIDTKCYLNFVYLVPRKKGSSPILAKAIDFFYRIFNQLKNDYLFLATYSEINSITISLIVLCFLAAIIFRSVFNSSSIVMCSFVSLILFDLHCSVLFLCFYIGTIMYL